MPNHHDPHFSSKLSLAKKTRYANQYTLTKLVLWRILTRRPAIDFNTTGTAGLIAT